MPQFQNLHYTTEVDVEDQVAIWQTESGQPMRLSVGSLKELVESDLSVLIPEVITEVATNGGTYELEDNDQDKVLWLTPAATIAGYTVVIPNTTTRPGQRIWIGVTNNITTLTADTSATLYQFPTSPNAGQLFAGIWVAEDSLAFVQGA